LWKYSSKRRTAVAALIRGRRLLTFPAHVRCLIESGAYSGVALIRVNTVNKETFSVFPQLISAEKARDDAQGELAKHTEVTLTS